MMAYSRAGRLARRAVGLWHLVIVLIAVSALGAPALRAQEAPMGVAILGVQEILQQASAGQAVQAEIRKRDQALKQEVEKRENALLAADQQLGQQRATLSAEEFASKRNEIRQQLNEVRKYAQSQKAAIVEVAQRGEARIRQALIEVVKEIAQERGITMVLNRAQVVMFPDQLDITQEALEKLNARLPSVDLTN